jgi:hypothetical protein
MKTVKFNFVKYLLILGLILPLASCKDDEVVDPPKRTDKEITAFSLPTLELTGVIDPVAFTITFTVTPDYDLSLLESVVPHIEYKGVNIEPVATAPQNFSQNVTYKVTAEDGSFQNYTVSLTESEFVAAGFGSATQVWDQNNWSALGFADNSENTLAYLNGKLVASRSGIILDAATGDPTGTKLNIEGIANGTFNGAQSLPNYPFAVTNDDAGNVIGVALGAWTKPNNPIYKWTSSLESSPELVYNLVSDTLVQFGRKVSVTGDVNGNGYIAQYNHNQAGAPHDAKQYVWKVTGGTVDPTPTVVAARTPGDRTYYQTLIPMTTTSVYPYYLACYGATSAVPPSEISYAPNASTEREIIEGYIEELTWSSKWGSYIYSAKKFDFNGVTYIAVISTVANSDYLAFMDTRNNRVVKYFEISIEGFLANGNGATSVTNSLEETLSTGEKKIRIYTLLANRGVLCHELTNRP